MLLPNCCLNNMTNKGHAFETYSVEFRTPCPIVFTNHPVQQVSRGYYFNHNESRFTHDLYTEYICDFDAQSHARHVRCETNATTFQQLILYIQILILRRGYRKQSLIYSLSGTLSLFSVTIVWAKWPGTFDRLIGGTNPCGDVAWHSTPWSLQGRQLLLRIYGETWKSRPNRSMSLKGEKDSVVVLWVEGSY